LSIKAEERKLQKAKEKERRRRGKLDGRVRQEKKHFHIARQGNQSAKE